MCITLPKWTLILSVISLIYGETFYVSPGNPSVDYILINFVNSTNTGHNIFCFSGTHIITRGSSSDDYNPNIYVFFILTMTGYIAPSSLVIPGDISTYPIIEADLTDPDHDTVFHCGLGVEARFQYLHFTTEVKDHGRFFASFHKFI
jgi:hypothetical protein